MSELIQLKKNPIKSMLPSLLKDMTTGKNIVFATNEYSVGGEAISETDQITIEVLSDLGEEAIQPRVTKSLEQQNSRTRKKGEVFTPSWICNKMNNHCDTEWFGREGVFNTEHDQSWEPTEEPISFPDDKGWQAYIDSTRLEITCGEAPYIVSRYDTTTGELIPIKRRIGILDRKMRVVNENTDNEKEWLKWTYRAFQSVYGYEFQGDNLLIARINLLLTYADYLKDRWGKTPTPAQLRKITNIIVWNLWQMDGITGTVPFGKPTERFEQMNFFDFMAGLNDTGEETKDCQIYDWRNDTTITYNSMKRG